MDSEEFRLHAKEVVDYIAIYLDNIRQRRPLPNVEPGYMKALVPETAPDDPEKWEDVFGDVERVIMPGVNSLHDIATYIFTLIHLYRFLDIYPKKLNCRICSVVKYSQDFDCYSYSCYSHSC